MSELYLSRLQLDPRNRMVQRALADCHTLHQHLLGALPTATTPQPREEFGVLYRIDVDPRTGISTLLVQSAARPDWGRSGALGLLGDQAPAIKEIGTAYSAIAPAARLRFRLRANPTRRVNRSRAGNDPLAGKRVEIRGEKEQRDWLDRKGEQCGFQVIDVQVRPGDALGAKQRGRRTAGDQTQQLTFATVIFDGKLEVTDAEQFRTALRQGIGSGKAYGFGLLSVAPDRE
jgi:CRISPR system Cascade subunit CasE